MAKKPNILYFVADQMRADAQHYLGNSASHTPNMDALAGEGVAFENAYCQNPVCVPSRCSFLSGLRRAIARCTSSRMRMSPTSCVP